MSDEFDAGPHATPDQVRAAEKRRAAARAAEVQSRSEPPVERTAPRKSTS